MASGSKSVKRTVSDRIDGVETEQLALLSLFVFVLLTTFVTMTSLVSFDRLVTILSGAEVWNGGVADNDGDARRIYRAIFPVEPEQAMIIPKLSRLAFVVVIGQIVHRTNQRLAEHAKGLSMFGIALYLALLFSIQNRRYEIAWVLAVQFFLLGYYGASFAFVALRSLPFLSAIPGPAQHTENSERGDEGNDSSREERTDDSRERRPRIRNPRD
ncbi:hypothetical protein [Halorussus ruber]|uniref:hypothetical protein n=1 Tax=Halorussus ruber TaxID=1126238 RepID=UPI0010923787|nr:hypothetical protein [Halorussus ruber]